LSLGRSGHSWLCSIAYHVRHDQCRREKDQAEEEEAEKAVPLPPATRAGQIAISVQRIKKTIDPNHQPPAAMTISAPVMEISFD
jgi:DNA-directed RNA polymerase specialized sigma24 family protein